MERQTKVTVVDSCEVYIALYVVEIPSLPGDWLDRAINRGTTAAAAAAVNFC